MLPVLAAAAAIAFVVLAWIGYEALAREFEAELVEDGTRSLDRTADMARVWFERYSALAPIYARDPRVTAALEAPGDAALARTLNRELEAWNGLAGTTDTYVMNRDGTTIAASNWEEAHSFVGRNFAFRPYFRDALEGRLGRFFGLGTTSGLRGYYFGAPVRDARGIIGVVVVKIAITPLEEDLRLGPHQAFFTDEAGIIVVAGTPALRLKRLGEIAEAERARIVETRQFDGATLGPAPVAAAGSWLDGTQQLVSAPDDSGSGTAHRYVDLSRRIETLDWTLHVLADTAVVNRRMTSALLTGGAGALALLTLASLLWQRRQRLVERLRHRERDRLALERRVAQRTAELTAANARLEAEVAERRNAEESLRRTQSELVQAGKLAALGQMSAALSHEFNQPLTAIRTYSENAIAFYEAGAGQRAAENLARVLRLTERMAQLSKHLTRFARRSQDDVTPVDLDAVLSDALGLLKGRIERAEAEVHREGDAGLAVLGGAVRLQHVVMNLVGNALDAVPADRTPEIRIALRRDGGEIEIAVEDNGTGIAPEALPRIFDPFFTTKEVGKGLGLGLSISFNIVKDFGGTMRAENGADGGARFVIRLPAAGTGTREAAE